LLKNMPSIVLPQPPVRISAATVIRWFRLPGDRFTAGDPLVELEAEEMLIVVEAAEAGTVAEILAKPGRTVEVGTELARVEFAGSRVAIAGNRITLENSMSEQSAPTGDGGVIPILMPQAGNTMEEGTVVAWLVKEGDAIAAGQAICEIETDKATIDFESPQSGRLARIVAQVGETVQVKEPIALLADNDAAAEAYLAAGKANKNSVAPAALPPMADVSAAGSTASAWKAAPPSTPGTGRIKASPAARTTAARRGIALAAVGAGSGPGGRVLSTDVASTPAVVGDVRTEQITAPRRTPTSKMRRAIGRNLQASKQTIPHFYMRLTIDAEPLLAFHRDQKPQANCTLNDVIVLGVGCAIGEFPAVRSQMAGDDLVEFPHASIGIAVGLEEGLVVPVVLAVDTLTLAQLAAETKRIVDNARRGRLENIGQGNFTISNLGMFGVEEFSAIINPPESGILAVSAIREAVVVENGAIRAGRTMVMTLSADHRLVDGVLAAKFMARLKSILEHPASELA
jgi:pyruvate dehydrogenase E2 component (dihydrolipoamide acetyltransferase)